MPLFAMFGQLLSMMLRVVPRLDKFLVFMGAVTWVRVLGAIGITAVSYPSILKIVNAAKEQLASLFGTLPADIFVVLCILQIPQGMGIMFSAILSVATYKAAKMVFTQR